MTFLGYDINEYKKLAEKMNKHNLVIYAEDPEFYRRYFDPNTIVDPTGLSCDKIRKHVMTTGNTNVVGIVDGDFNYMLEHENLFKIDYYSIENILLVNHQKLSDLRSAITDFVDENHIIKYSLDITFDSNNFYLKKKTKSISDVFDSYVNRKIINSKMYIRYMDLKWLIQAYQKNF